MKAEQNPGEAFKGGSFPSYRILAHFGIAFLAMLSGLVVGLVFGVLLYLLLCWAEFLHSTRDIQGDNIFPSSSVTRISAFIHMGLGLVYYAAHASGFLRSMWFAVPLSVDVGLVAGCGLVVVGSFLVSSLVYFLWVLLCCTGSYLLALDASCEHLSAWVWIVCFIVGSLPGAIYGAIVGGWVFHRARGGQQSYREYMELFEAGTSPSGGL